MIAWDMGEIIGKRYEEEPGVYTNVLYPDFPDCSHGKGKGPRERAAQRLKATIYWPKQIIRQAILKAWVTRLHLLMV